ncbi:MAG TPA: S9 family peptidase [Caldithrix abyssi]|uniref:S9 family peptidase n=1 Tax=Caldithrix abyssi TaxID=187145 RepID=A0A7V4U4T5_CALAY|nr:S9 family peptidase [Caldithrix abyssi]
MYRQIVIILFFVASLFAGKAPFSIEALYKIKNVGDPRISPDGRRVAFVVTSYILQEGSSNSDIYLIDADGGNLRRMTYYDGADYHPRWSPDGKEILFISSRKNGAQAWLLPVDGGEARQLTDFYGGVSDVQWVGSSTQIVFTSAVFPECGARQDCNKNILESLKAGPLFAHLADRLFYRHWTSYKDGKRSHIILYDSQNNSYRDLTPGDYDAPAMWGRFTLSPDGGQLCFESNRDEFEAENTNKDLFLVDVKSGQMRKLTARNQAYDGQPVFSPDGSKIAYQMQKVPGFESDLKRLAVYDLKTNTVSVLTESFDNWTQNYRWAPDGKSVYFIAHEKAHFPLYRVGLDSGRIEKIADLKTIDAYDVSPDGNWLVAVRRTIDHPAELFRLPVQGNWRDKKAQRLTFFNKAIEDSVDLRPAKEVWIKSPKTGLRIHTFIILPHNFDPTQKYPLILNVHGGPQYQWYDGFRGDWQVYPGYGYIVAFPNPHGSTGYGQAFTNAISRDWGGKVYEDVMAVTDYLAKLDYVDENRMGAMGWSYGGYMMMWLEGHTTRFKALAAMMGVYDLPAMYGSTEELWFPHWDLGGAPWENPDLYARFSPHNYVNNFATPCLVITGERDYRVPYTQSLEFFTALQKKRVPSRLIVFPNDGHWPGYVTSMPFYYNAHLDWFHTYLGGKPAPYDMQKMLRNQAFGSSTAKETVK